MFSTRRDGTSDSTFLRLLVVMLLTVVLVRGIRESAETNNVMVILKIAAILAFVFAGMHYIHPGELPSLRAQRMVWHPHRRLHHFLYLHRLRFGFDRRGRG